MAKNKICFVVSSIATVKAFLKDHIALLSTEFDVYLVGNFNESECNEAKKIGVKDCKSIAIHRNINLFSDLKSVLALRTYFNQMNFHVIHSVTPKAGLISAIAGKIAGVKYRIHIFTGQVWHTKTGLMKRMLIFLDQVIAKLNTHLLVDGESQRQHLIRNRVLRDANSTVLGKGSISGVNIDRFSPNSKTRELYRKKLNIAKEDVVFVFLGRLNIDKGIRELFEAFSRLCNENLNAHLLIVGSDEMGMLNELSQYPPIKKGGNFTFYGFCSNPEEVLQAANVFCLPSYREGFGTSVIEASCLGLPVICSDTYGIKDAMIDNVTGLRHKVKDVDSLFLQIKRLAENKELRQELGENGRVNVLENFSSQTLSKAWLEYYKKLV